MIQDSNKIKYVTLNEVVGEFLKKPPQTEPYFISGKEYFDLMRERMNANAPRPIITEDADFEVIEPKKLPESKNQLPQ